MVIYLTMTGIVAGICLGIGVLYLFVGIRRKTNKLLTLIFSIFAIAYGATILMGIFYHQATALARHIALVRWDTIFVVSAFVTLLWYVGVYTRVKPRWVLWSLTAFFILPGIANILRPNMVYQEIQGLAYFTFPWGERLAFLVGTDSIWTLLFFLARLLGFSYILVACLIQYRQGERQPALLLGAGIAWLLVTILYELLGESGVIPYIPLGEFGFLGLAIFISIQMANEVIRTEETLEEHQKNLERLVADRTADLENTQGALVAEAQIRAVTDERIRISRDLHDSVTQAIYSASLIAEVLPQVWERSPEEGERNLTKLRQLVRGALAEMRTLLFELRPSSLDAADLPTLLRQQADAISGRTRIQVEIVIKGTPEPLIETKIALYRISQEAFNNIAKHSGASKVDVYLDGKNEQTTLQIKDNGRGFDPLDVQESKLGLQIMGERARAVGGWIQIDASPGQGTSVLVTVGESLNSDFAS